MFQAVYARAVTFLLYSINCLFCFADSKGVRTTKNKKKNRRKEQLKDSSDSIDVNYNKVGTLPSFPFVWAQGSYEHSCVCAYETCIQGLHLHSSAGYNHNLNKQTFFLAINKHIYCLNYGFIVKERNVIVSSLLISAISLLSFFIFMN